MSLIHPLPRPISSRELPERFPSPFAHQPHALAILAASDLQRRLQQPELQQLFACDQGNMLGVLVVQDAQGQTGYLSGFAGQLHGQWLQPGFVPPIFSLDQYQPRQQTYLQQRQQLQARIAQLQQDAHWLQCRRELQQQQAQYDLEFQNLLQEQQLRKQARQLRRQQLGPQDEAERQALARQSQHDKFLRQHTQKQWQEQLATLQLQQRGFEEQLTQLTQSLQQLEAQLQQADIDAYRLTNLRGEVQPMQALLDLQHKPGSGDCAASKLLHYAIQQRLKPIALSEFWWGPMPAGDIRHHGQHYPACRGRCRPLLEFMLQGLEHDQPPLHVNLRLPQGLDILFEDDELLVINKPAGLLSVPGREVEDSVLRRLQLRYPEASGPLLLHRLDLSTSGLLLAAKTSDSHYALQQQFLQRSIQKRYVALLSRPLTQQEGDIHLPLRVDLLDRPRQVVCYEYGKAAHTHWQRLTVEGQYTRVHFHPITGRTHQLRIHAAHPLGLNAPIVGDELYGQSGQRLMLHAEQLCFQHPRSGETLCLSCPAPF